MIENQIFKGLWYLPESTVKLAGTLTFDPVGGTNLEVVGRFSNNLPHSPINVLHGETLEGLITLIDSNFVTSKASYGSSPVSVTSYSPSFIFQGHLFDTPEQINFTSSVSGIFNLLEWIGNNPVEEDNSPSEFTVIYNKINDISFPITDGCEGAFTFNMIGRHENDAHKYAINRFCKLRLTYTDPVPFQKILNDIFVFVGFITLVTYEQSYPTSLEFYHPDITEWTMNPLLKGQIPKTIKCYYHNSFYNPNNKVRRRHKHLTPYKAVAAKLDTIISQWYLKSVELEPVIKMLLSHFLTKNHFTIEKFMDTIRALETFHRHNFSEKTMSAKELKRKIRAIAASANCSSKDTRWLKEKLQYANELPLMERLTFLSSRYSFPFFIEKVPDAKIICRQATDNRNYYTHFSPHLKNRLLSVRDLFSLTEKWRLILLSAVFQSIDIDIKMYEDGIRREISW